MENHDRTEFITKASGRDDGFRERVCAMSKKGNPITITDNEFGEMDCYCRAISCKFNWEWFRLILVENIVGVLFLHKASNWFSKGNKIKEYYSYMDSGRVPGFAEGRKAAAGRKAASRDVKPPKGVKLPDDKGVKGGCHV